MKFFADNIPQQNSDFDFSLIGRQYHDKVRYAKKNYFHRHLANGEIVKRDWSIYSPSTGKVYCYMCQLFSKDDNQITTGFNDWKNATARIASHEQSKNHLQSVAEKVQYRKNNSN